MTVFILKIIGLAIVAAVLAVGSVCYVSASRLEKEIEAEIRDSKE